MNERNEHVLFDLFDGLVLDEVRPNAPILLGRIEHLIVDPSAVWCLQKRVVQEKAEPAARLEHSSNFGNGVVDIADVFEHETRHHGIERCIRKRQCSGTRAHVRGSPAALLGHLHLVPCGIETHHALGAKLHCHTAHLAVAATDIEHALGVGQLGCS